jgi:hypothetical protein
MKYSKDITKTLLAIQSEELEGVDEKDLFGFIAFELSKIYSEEIDRHIRLHIRQKPKWFPFGQKVWERIAAKFLTIESKK